MYCGEWSVRGGGVLVLVGGICLCICVSVCQCDQMIWSDIRSRNMFYESPVDMSTMVKCVLAYLSHMFYLYTLKVNYD